CEFSNFNPKDVTNCEVVDLKVDEYQCLQDTVQNMDKNEFIVLIRKKNDMLGRSPASWKTREKASEVIGRRT
ncbi:hypothetical protein ACUWC3_28800, partial [Klebsiella pneumoniae]|uniref:hypothetical protein n=1 Tax=Klebsiella pneumoniae TaxID=573 RepID=UPI0040553F22